MKPTLIVAGLGRCGTSLTMQMLHTAGVSCIGDWPAFEGEAGMPYSRGPITWEMWRAARGKAVKILDPHHLTIAWPLDHDLRAIWLSRDPAEQAKSQIKMAITFVDGAHPINRTGHRRWSSRLVRDAWVARTSLRHHLGANRVLEVAYEDLITARQASALRIAQFSGFGFDQAVLERMAACVRKTDPRCAPALELEGSLLDERRRA